ncbi:MAG: hypothetical protein N2B03_06695 [Boseongicola sp.]
MRISSALTTAVVFAVAIGLGGCSLFSSDDKEKSAAAEAAASEALITPIEAVLHVEIGRTRNGYVITAHGVAPGIGYGAPELRARRQGKAGPDGIIDFDFVAQAPDPNLNLGDGPVEARSIQADLLVTAKELEGSAGIRIHGVKGGLQMKF